ncbi:MAG: diguanylate cyclase domain-containing protein [Candidatus Brocadia sp.]
MEDVRKQFDLYRSTQYAISLVLAASDTFEDAVPKILKTMCESLQWSLAEFWIVDKGTNKLRLAEVWHTSSEKLSEFVVQSRQITFSPGEGLPGGVWVSGKPSWIVDIGSDPDFHRAKIADEAGLTTAIGFPLITASAMNALLESVTIEVGLRGAVGFPVRKEGEVFGVIVLFSNKAEKPDEELLRMFHVISVQIGQFIKLKQTEETLRRKINFEKTVAKISTRFVNTLDFSNEISDSLADMGRLCNATRVCLFQFHTDKNSVTEKIDRAYEWYDEGIISNIQNLQDMYSARYSWLMENLNKGTMVYITDVSDIAQGVAFEKEILEKSGIKSLLIIPVRVEEKLLGFISFDNVPDIDNLHEDNITLLHMIGEIMGGAIIRKQSESLIRHMAYHDPLTNLPNRLLFRDRLQIGIMQAKRGGRMLAVAILDLDTFKTINDSLGHHIGDLLLKVVAERLTRCVRGSDTVARTGGDEFSIILPDLTQVPNAAVVAQKILDVVDKPYLIEDHKIHTSASIGISIYPLDSHNIDDLIKMADKAMYYSKQSGGNTFRFYNIAMNKHVQAHKE